MAHWLNGVWRNAFTQYPRLLKLVKTIYTGHNLTLDYRGDVVHFYII